MEKRSRTRLYGFFFISHYVCVRVQAIKFVFCVDFVSQLCQKYHFCVSFVDDFGYWCFRLPANEIFLKPFKIAYLKEKRLLEAFF